MKFIYTLGMSVFLYMAVPISAQNLFYENKDSDNHINNTQHKINYQDKTIPYSSDPILTETYTEKDHKESYPPENGSLPYFTDSKGELNISSFGSSNYTVPIALPPGIKNVAPQISF